MGLLDLHAAQAGINEPSLQSLPRTLGERLDVTAAEVFAPDRYFTITGARRDQWQRSVDELHAATGQTFANPYGAMTAEEMARLGNQPAVIEERRNRIIEASRLARAEGREELFDPENIDRYIAEEANRRRQRAGEMEGTGNGFLNFLGGAVLETATPHGLLGLLVPVSRLPTAAASSIGRTFLGNVSREAALQAGANAGLQLLAEGLDATSRGELGTGQTLGEVALNVAGAATIGAVLGGGIRALHLKWLGLPEAVRANAPLEVRDAFKIIEADALYSGQNRLGVDPLLHERYQGRANDAVLRGLPPDLSDLSRTADTPMTALATILRQPTTPDIRVRDPVPLFERMLALPDSEIEPFARELRPRSFARLDKVDAELGTLRTRIEELQAATPTIANLVDPDTAMRLADIDADLARPALSRRQRDALEQERDMIVGTVDPKDRLPKKARAEQRKQLLDLERRVAKLEATRGEALATAEKATADLRRKLERYEALAEPADAVARDLGFAEPAGLADAIERADFERQTRMVHGMVPEGPPVPIRPDEATAPVKAEPTPEAMQALDTETQRILATPGALGDFRGAAIRDLDAVDREMADARAAAGCAMSGVM